MNKGKFKNILLVSDMDGTLLSSSHEISIENIERLNYFVDNGGRFTIATGRIESTLGLYTHLLPITEPVILYNGGRIYDYKTDSVIWECCLESKIKTILSHIYAEFPEVGIEVFHDRKIYFVNQNDETAEHIIRERLPAPTGSIEEIPLPWSKVLLAWNPVKLAEIEALLEKNYASDLRWVYSEKQFLELLNTNVSKGHALDVLLDLIGIPIEKVIAVGDNLNDFELVNNSGTGYAVSNAHIKILETADRVSVSNDEHAIAHIINEIEVKAEF